MFVQNLINFIGFAIIPNVRQVNGTVYSMGWSYGAECWSGVESDIRMTNSGHRFAPDITEHSTIGKTDCSFDPGHA